MDLGLKNKVAMVTGAGSQTGFGRGIALALGKEGCNVIVVDMDLKGAEETATKLKSMGRDAVGLKADVTSGEEVNAMVKAGLAKFGNIDILVNNVGRNRLSPFTETTEEDWHISIDTQLKGMWYCCKAVLPHMLGRKSGRIITLSSTPAVRGLPQASLYSAGNSAVIGMTKALAPEVGFMGISVNVVMVPGTDDVDSNASEQQDIANVVVFLASEAGSDLTSQTMLTEAW
jgi:NAD(P)-dependent dehydrogenase (short-subunit alcohol dehydrogenase family)